MQTPTSSPVPTQDRPIDTSASFTKYQDIRTSGRLDLPAETTDQRQCRHQPDTRHQPRIIEPAMTEPALHELVAPRQMPFERNAPPGCPVRDASLCVDTAEGWS